MMALSRSVGHSWLPELIDPIPLNENPNIVTVNYEVCVLNSSVPENNLKPTFKYTLE